MNEKLIKPAVLSGMVRHVHLKDPNKDLYFINADASIKDLEHFAELIISKCQDIANLYHSEEHAMPRTKNLIAQKIKEYFQK